jgi:uncharacterized membrane protein YbhN (UPF0104 family)
MNRLRLLVRLALPVGLSLAACGLLGWYLLRHQDQWRTVSLASPWLLGVCAAASLAALLAPGLIFWVMTSRVGRNVGLAESTWLAVMTSAINSVVPLHAGAAARLACKFIYWGVENYGHFFKNQITRQIKIRKINKKYDNYKLIHNYLKGHG